MLELKNITIAEHVQRVVIPKGKFHFHLTRDSLNRTKLTGYVPKVGQLAVLADYMAVAKVVKGPNSIKDILIEYEDGTRMRVNLISTELEGFIDVD